MQEPLLFEYAVVRVVPHVEREEFINVGIVLLCSARKYLGSTFHVDEKKLKALCEEFDIDELRDYIDSFNRICGGGAQGGAIGLLPPHERFRWLTAARSTVLQTSKVHPGLCHDPAEMLSHLHSQLVL